MQLLTWNARPASFEWRLRYRWRLGRGGEGEAYIIARCAEDAVAILREELRGQCVDVVCVGAARPVNN